MRILGLGLGLGLGSLGLVGCARVAAAPAIPPGAPAALTEQPVSIPADRVEAGSPPQPQECDPPDLGRRNEPDFAFARTTIERVMRWSGTPAVAVAVARDGVVLWEEGFGFADLARRRKATEYTPFSVASITKPLTATALMVLVERNFVTLEAPINRYLGDGGIVGGAGDVEMATVERVASHTAGLPLHYQFFYEDTPQRAPDPVETARSHAHLVTEPGERYQYSNLGFGLLQRVVTRVSGQDYADFMRTAVFEPLAMSNTSVDLPGQTPKGAAIRYGGDRKPLPDYGFDHDGASAVYSSAHDLVRFGLSHLGHRAIGQKRVLSAVGRERMRQPVDPAKYGLGWSLYRTEGHTAFGHSGGMPGVRGQLTMWPDQDVVAVVLANSSAIGNLHVEIRHALVDALDLPSRSDDLCRLPKDHGIFGRWTGRVRPRGGPLPLELDVKENGEVQVTLAGTVHRLRHVSFAAGVLRGRFLVAGGLDRPTAIGLELKLRGGRLDGSVTELRPGVSATTVYGRLERAPDD